MKKPRLSFANVMSSIAVFLALGGVGWAASEPAPSVELVDVTFKLGTKATLSGTGNGRLPNTVVATSLTDLQVTRNGARADADGRIYTTTDSRDGTISGRVVLNRSLSSCLPLSARWASSAGTYSPTAVTGGFKPEMLTVSIVATSSSGAGGFNIYVAGLPAWSGTAPGRPKLGSTLYYLVTNSFACASNH